MLPPVPALLGRRLIRRLRARLRLGRRNRDRRQNLIEPLDHLRCDVDVDRSQHDRAAIKHDGRPTFLKQRVEDRSKRFLDLSTGDIDAVLNRGLLFLHLLLKRFAAFAQLTLLLLARFRRQNTGLFLKLLRVGAQLFAAKMEHHIDILGEDEVWIVAESPNGFKRSMIEYQLEDRSAQFPNVRHELGGVPTFVLTRALWNAVRDIKCTGTRPISDADLKTADKLIMPKEYSQLPGFKRP